MRIVHVRWAAVLLGLALSGEAGAAGAQRTFVASYGSDADPCSFAQPCRGFQAAINAVAAGGEVVALDSAGYGAMSIAKSVSVIVPPGVHAGLSPATGIPIPGFSGPSTVVLINIADTDVVVLRGLNVNHQATVSDGIAWVGSHNGAVHIENTVVNGFPAEGIFVQAGDGVAPPRLHLKDSILRQNQFGLVVQGGHPTNIVMDHVRTEGNSGAGLRSVGPHLFDVRDTVIAGNNHGIESREFSPVGAGNFTLESCVISQNDVAFFFVTSPGVASFIDVSGSLYSHNAHGYTETNAAQNVRSRGNNTVLGNGPPGPFNSTFPPE
jgi:hypothetical protein